MPCRQLATASLALAILLAACSPPAPVPSPGSGSDEVVVYVIDRGWHTDVGLPVDEINGPLTSLEAAFPGVRFLTFGFGERQFLVNRRRTLGAMLNALLPSHSALLVTALRAPPALAFGAQKVVALHVSPNGLAAIEASIWHEFQPMPGAESAPLTNGPYPGSVFYAARETYSGLFTCNTWTAEILRTGGLPFRVIGVLFASQVMGQAHWLARAQQPRSGH